MKIKRFVAPDMRQAMRQVRDEQGPDAVILSTHLLHDVTACCARVAILHRGRLRHDGALTDLAAAGTGSDSLETVFFRIASGGDAQAAA